MHMVKTSNYTECEMKSMNLPPTLDSHFAPQRQYLTVWGIFYTYNVLICLISPDGIGVCSSFFTYVPVISLCLTNCSKMVA